MNIWLHPPREGLFKILEINPFPYIKYPLEIGNSWEWDFLEPGSNWGDERWLTWNGTLDILCEYEIT